MLKKYYENNALFDSAFFRNLKAWAFNIVIILVLSYGVWLGLFHFTKNITLCDISSLAFLGFACFGIWEWKNLKF